MSRPLRLLVLEDRARDAELMIEQLRSSGFEPEWTRAQSRQDFLAEIEKQPDLILADYNLPQFSGLEAIQLLREQSLDIPLIVVSGTVGEDKAVECIKQGAADYLLKDRLARLGEAVKRALAERQLRLAQKQSETALRESEERFRRLAENAPDVIFRWRVTSPGSFEYLSPAIVALTGYTPEDFYGEPGLLLNIAHPDDRAQIEGMANGVTPFVQMQVRIIHKEGRTVWVERRSSPVYDQAGTIIVTEGILRDITEQKRAEENLRYHADLLEQISDAVISTDLDFRIRSWNRAAEHIYGWQAEEAIGKSLPEIVTTTYQNGSSEEEALRRFLTDGFWQGEVVQSRKDGTPVAILSSVKATGDSTGKMVGVVAVNRDITERKQAEAAEREQRLLADALRDTAAELSSTLDLNEVLDHILENVGRVLPHDAGTIMLVEGDTVRVVSHSGYAERGLGELASQVKFQMAEVPSLAHMARTGQNLCVADTREYTGWVSTEAVAWVRSSIGAPIRIGEEILGFINLDSEIPGFFSSEQAARLQAFADQAAAAVKNAKLYHELESYSEFLEQAVAERTAQLQATTDRVETILSSVGDALTVMHMDGRIQQVNRAFERQTGYSATEAELQDHHDLLQIDFGSKGDYHGALESLTPGQVWQGQTKVRRKDGSIYHADFTVAPVRDDAGSIRLLVASIRDITPLKEVERAKDEFVSNVSHELRTPITGIKLNYSMLSMNPERRDVYMERMRREINRLNELIEDLLRLTRLEQGHVELALASVDLNTLGSELVNDRAPVAETRDLSLTFEANSGLEPVIADPGLLGQSLSVLLTNAINYTPAGGQIVVSAVGQTEQDKRWSGLSVSDTGPGVLPEEQPKLFARFYRGTAGRASGAAGTGLGLNIAKQIVERHSGRLELYSEGIPGKGTTFTIWLPVGEPKP